MRQAYLLCKRLFDICLSLFGIIIFSPIALIIIAAILLHDGLPIFFCDQRIGKDGRVFKALKFRSMIKDAEKIAGSVYAVDKDSRITPVGRLIRSTAMDELPQLINILKGDMSFVGPRPEKVNYAEEFRKTIPNYDLRHRIRPGLTGPAQVYLKYDSPMEEKLKYDIAYVQGANIIQDIRLILDSFRITLRGGWEKFEKP